MLILLPSAISFFRHGCAEGGIESEWAGADTILKVDPQQQSKWNQTVTVTQLGI
jgi:hypothetical protein